MDYIWRGNICVIGEAEKCRRYHGSGGKTRTVVWLRTFVVVLFITAEAAMIFKDYRIGFLSCCDSLTSHVWWYITDNNCMRRQIAQPCSENAWNNLLQLCREEEVNWVFFGSKKLEHSVWRRTCVVKSVSWVVYKLFPVYDRSVLRM